MRVKPMNVQDKIKNTLSNKFSYDIRLLIGRGTSNAPGEVVGVTRGKEEEERRRRKGGGGGGGGVVSIVEDER